VGNHLLQNYKIFKYFLQNLLRKVFYTKYFASIFFITKFVSISYKTKFIQNWQKMWNFLVMTLVTKVVIIKLI